MRIVDRLVEYLDYKKISAYSFERTCQVANAYLKKTLAGKGSIGSDILQKIYANYSDLNLVWLITGDGAMLMEEKESRLMVKEGRQHYSKDELIRFLNEKIVSLEDALTDKEKIIMLLEEQLAARKK